VAVTAAALAEAEKYGICIWSNNTQFNEYTDLLREF